MWSAIAELLTLPLSVSYLVAVDGSQSVYLCIMQQDVIDFPILSIFEL